MKSTFILLLSLLFSANFAWAQPCTPPGGTASFSIGLGELCNGIFIIDLNDGPNSDVDHCFCPSFPTPAGCIGDVAALNIPGVNQFVVPRNLGNGCGGFTIPSNMSLINLTGKQCMSTLNISIQVPGDLVGCNMSGSVEARVFKWIGEGVPNPNSKQGWTLVSVSLGTYEICDNPGPPPPAPTDIGLSSPNYYNCTWNSWVSAVPGAVNYIWSGTVAHVSTNTTGPVMEAGWTYSLCVHVIDDCGQTSPQYCETINVPEISGCGWGAPESGDLANKRMLAPKGQVISPNPFVNEITIADPNSEQDELNFQIFDLQGKLWREGIYEDGQTFSLEGLPKGVYIFKTANWIERLIKQ